MSLGGSWVIASPERAQLWGMGQGKTCARLPVNTLWWASARAVSLKNAPYTNRIILQSAARTTLAPAALVFFSHSAIGSRNAQLPNRFPELPNPQPRAILGRGRQKQTDHPVWRTRLTSAITALQ